MTWLRAIAEIGITRKTPPVIADKIRITNIYSFFFGWIVILYSLFFIAIDLRFFGFMALPFGVVYFSVLAVNRSGLYKFAKYLVVLNFCAVVYVFSSSVGRDSGIHFWFVPAMFVPFLLFSLSEKKTLFMASFTPVGLFLFLWFTHFQYQIVRNEAVSPDQAHVISVLMILGSFGVSFSSVLFLLQQYEKMLRLKLSTDRSIDNYARVLEAAGLVSFVDRDGKFTHVNDRFCQVSGYTVKELIGSSHTLVNGGFHSKSFFEDLWATILDKKSWTGDICNRSKDGKLFWLATVIVPMVNEVGEIEQFVSIQHDVTHGKVAEQSALQSAKLASLGEMSGGIAHEINNPVGIIHGKASQLLKLLRADQFSVDRGIEQLDKIVFEANRVAKIIKGLLAFARDGERDPLVSVEVGAVLSDVLNLCAGKFRGRGVSLEVGSVPVTSIECRPTQLAQVLSNLINNAFDAVGSLQEKWVRIGVTLLDGMVRITVTDSGAGIPAAIAANMMQPFFTTKPVGKGTGLGLSISKGIVEDHGGRFWLDRGAMNTCFVIELPIKQDPQARAAIRSS